MKYKETDRQTDRQRHRERERLYFLFCVVVPIASFSRMVSFDVYCSVRGLFAF